MDTNRRNFLAFLWHAVFLAFASNFMDIDTIIPSMIYESGGKAIHIGIMTTILLGGSSLTQLLFAPLVSNFKFKKGFLILGISLRILSVLGLGILLYLKSRGLVINALFIIFILITIFSVSGSFANISYTDVLGKSIGSDLRKRFFSLRQVISGIIIILSATFARKIISSFSYPLNYAILFGLGGAALFIASWGFWSIKEEIPSSLKITGLRSYIKTLKNELKNNKQILYFLGFINSQGIAVTLLPFIMLYAKQELLAQSTATGNFLLFKTFGLVLVSAFVLIKSTKIRYNNLLYLNSIITLMTITLAIFMSNLNHLLIIYVLGGIIYALYSITMNGVLLEISGHTNRVIYTGLAGAGNILPAIFPLFGGVIIEKLGFNILFYIYIPIILISLFFIRKLKCKK